MSKCLAKFRVFYIRPESPVLQVRVLHDFVRGTDRPGVGATLLQAVVGLIPRDVGEEVFENSPNMGLALGDDRRILVLFIQQVAGQAVLVQPRRQRQDPLGCNLADVHVFAILAENLGVGPSVGVATSGSARDHSSFVNVLVHVALGSERAGIMYRDVYVLPPSRNRTADQRRGEGDVGVVTSDVPGLPSTGSDGRRARHNVVIVAAPGHLSARCQMQQVAGLEVLPRPGLPERGQ